jgi:hypothetical protein
MEDAAGYVKRGYVLRTYEQRFPVSKYGSALTVENEAKVVLLDKIAGELQHRFDEEMVPLLALYKAGTLTDDDRARVFDFIRYGVSVMNRASQIIHKDSAHQKMKR